MNSLYLVVIFVQHAHQIGTPTPSCKPSLHCLYGISTCSKMESSENCQQHKFSFCKTDMLFFCWGSKQIDWKLCSEHAVNSDTKEIISVSLQLIFWVPYVLIFFPLVSYTCFSWLLNNVLLFSFSLSYNTDTTWWNRKVSLKYSLFPLQQK